MIAYRWVKEADEYADDERRDESEFLGFFGLRMNGSGDTKAMVGRGGGLGGWKKRGKKKAAEKKTGTAI